MKKRNSVAHFIPRTVTMQEATEAKGGLDLQGAASLLMAMMQASAADCMRGAVRSDKG